MRGDTVEKEAIAMKLCSVLLNAVRHTAESGGRRAEVWLEGRVNVTVRSGAGGGAC